MKKNVEGGRVRRQKAGVEPKSTKRDRPSVADVMSLTIALRPALAPRSRKRVVAGTRLALTLSEDERKLILNTWSISGGLTDVQLKTMGEAEKPELSMTLVDWEDFGGWVAGTGNHARSGSRLRSRADALFDRIQGLLDSHVEE